MVVYSINREIGWTNGGVEHAQLYRANVLRGQGLPMKFIYTNLITTGNIADHAERLGWRADEIIWMYQAFTDIPITTTNYTCEDLENQFLEKADRIEKDENSVRYYFDGKGQEIFCYRTGKNAETISVVDWIQDHRLFRKDFYSNVRVFSEYFIPKDGKAKVFQRKFFNLDGSVALDQRLDSEGNSIFRYKEYTFDSVGQLLNYFIKSLQLSEDDVMLLDVSVDSVGQAVLEHRGKAKVGVVMHSEHFQERETDDASVYWSVNYEYVFTHYQQIDFYIAATQAQNDFLAKQFKHYKNASPRIVTIPVGNLKGLDRPENNKRRPHSLVTASRLIYEKHNDWLVLAAVKVHEKYPDLTFDIYGSGDREEEIAALIKELKAEDYIKMKGYVNMDGRYSRYELYLSGSLTEGFGLTLMEAVGAGNAIIGFDAPYGNPTFIEDEKNGYLIPFAATESPGSKKMSSELAEKILQFFELSDKEKEAMENRSYEIAAAYLMKEVRSKWLELLENK